jgi:hypothetical protein
MRPSNLAFLWIASFAFLSLNTHALSAQIEAVSSQYFVGNVPLEEINAIYLQLDIESTNAGQNFRAVVDYGQAASSRSDRRIRDRNGKDVRFNTPYHVLNTFADLGYVIFELSYGSRGLNFRRYPEIVVMVRVVDDGVTDGF